FIVILWFPFFDDDGNKTAPIAPQRISVVFPSQGEFIDEVKARQALSQGIALYEQQNYLSLVQASKFFPQSLFHQFQINPASGYSIMSYSRLYPNAVNKTEAATTVFNLIRVSQDRLLTVSIVAIG